MLFNADYKVKTITIYTSIICNKLYFEKSTAVICGNLKSCYQIAVISKNLDSRYQTEIVLKSLISNIDQPSVLFLSGSQGTATMYFRNKVEYGKENRIWRATFILMYFIKSTKILYLIQCACSILY